jgi:MscS family membrane protein
MREIIFEMGITVICLAGVVLTSFVVGFVWRNVFKRMARKTPTKLDIMIFEYTEKPVGSLVLVTGFYFVMRRLAKYQLMDKFPVLKIINGIFYVAVAIVVSLFVYALIKAILDWYAQEKALKLGIAVQDFIPLVKRLTQAAILFISIMIILGHFNVNISGLIATAGIASLAFALAAQDAIANMIAGFLIMVDRPLRVDDRVELADGTMGDVLEIGLRSTKILSFDNTVVVVPNSEIAKTRITNFGYPNPKVKIRQVISVAYGSDIARVKEILKEICQRHPDVLDDPVPDTYFTEFGESSLNVLLVCWVSDYKEKFRIIDELNMEIKKKFEEENVEIPFPQRDVHVYSKGSQNG